MSYDFNYQKNVINSDKDYSKSNKDKSCQN